MFEKLGDSSRAALQRLFLNNSWEEIINIILYTKDDILRKEVFLAFLLKNDPTKDPYIKTLKDGLEKLSFYVYEHPEKTKGMPFELAIWYIEIKRNEVDVSDSTNFEASDIKTDSSDNDKDDPNDSEANVENSDKRGVVGHKSVFLENEPVELNLCKFESDMKPEMYNNQEYREAENSAKALESLISSEYEMASIQNATYAWLDSEFQSNLTFFPGRIIEFSS